MRFRFLHFADAHLGYQQYNVRERFNDFGRAYLHVVDRAISEGVDFVVFSGDLFHKRTLDPPTLLQAVTGLERLREARIPVIAVEGNHERPHYRDVHSWLDFLAAQGYLIALTPAMREGRPELSPWDGSTGCYHDILPGIRIYGIKYYGAASSRVVEAMTEALEASGGASPDYVIMAMHAGVEGVVPHASAVLSHAELAPLRPHVDYLAMGHIHKPFQREGWIHNPGSLETCGVDEAAWPDRGYYLVQVDSSRDPKHRATLVETPRRPFVRLRLDVGTCASPEALHEAVGALADREAAPAADPPVIQVTLDGVLPFDRRDLDREGLEAALRERLQPLLVLLHDRTVSADYEVSPNVAASRADLEEQIVADLVRRDARYSAGAEDWAQLILDVKRMALESVSPHEIIDHVRRRRSDLGEAPP